MTAPTNFPRFFVTSPAPCPYLANRTERKVFTELKGPQAQELNEALGRIGFRRSQTVAYRPSCQNCQACISVRVVADEFKPSSTQRRNIRRNSDLIVTECRPWATSEQFELLRRYLCTRHPEGGMATMDEIDFADMVEHTPVSTFVTEYREPDGEGGAGRLIGACLTDRQEDGLSMIYSFYDPEQQDRSGLGNYIILDHIRRTAEDGLPYVYLGYWVEGSRQMQYKIRYRPLERLGPDGWRRFGDEEQSRLISAASSGEQGKAPAISGGTKDGTPGGQKQYKLS
ncbi:arginyltransferase [Altericroceibacterium spongiae]|uniref:Aspartate/glutamate leucyltransferase n=1 Tax=Altericroceibacterium spongiae TaxID=2320269 RepID=A0A420EMV9_9SPHN|nr:arginyltransferase [Altericroceibacterium spongiae]RKF22049.1 arginyltransferase [Altericroceibacterium spongiae]